VAALFDDAHVKAFDWQGAPLQVFPAIATVVKNLFNGQRMQRPETSL
jgi:hypothetical protein